MDRSCICVLVFVIATGPPATAQQIHTGTGASSIGSTYSESGSVNRVSGSLGFNFAQGSSRSLSGTSQSMTNMNGNPGSFFSGSVRPFVLGVTPVVGNYPTGNHEIADIAAASQKERLSSIAQGNLERRYEKLRSYLIRAELAETEGDAKKARANYALALRIADDPLRSKIQAKLLPPSKR
jgi:hypothetical protein